MRMSLNPGEFKELLLSHHPDLPCFNDDVIVIFNRRVCAGCLLAYPTALVVLVLLQPSGYESIFSALVFALLSQLRRLSKNLIIQHVCRFVAGIALGFGLGGGYWAIISGQWLLVAALTAGAGLYVLSKAYSITSKLPCGNTIVPDERV
jgi:hypothetical protein